MCSPGVPGARPRCSAVRRHPFIHIEKEETSMRWIRYADRAGTRWGVLHDDAVLPLGAGRDGEAQVEALLRGQATAPDADGGALVPLEGLRLLPPLLPGATLYCVGLNYKSHVDETGRDLPPQPAIFIRTPASVVGANEALEHPGVSAQFDFEGEVAVVIGEGGRGIRREDALRHVAGYTCFNDASVRGRPPHPAAVDEGRRRSRGHSGRRGGAAKSGVVGPCQPAVVEVMLQAGLDDVEVGRYVEVPRCIKAVVSDMQNLPMAVPA